MSVERVPQLEAWVDERLRLAAAINAVFSGEVSDEVS